MKFDLATILVYDLRVCSTIYVGAINEEAQVSGAAGKRTVRGRVASIVGKHRKEHYISIIKNTFDRLPFLNFLVIL